MKIKVESLNCEQCNAPLDVRGQMSTLVKCDYCGTNNVIVGSVSLNDLTIDHDLVIRLRKQLEDLLSINELRELVFEFKHSLPEPYQGQLDVDNIIVSGSGKVMATLNLIDFAERRLLVKNLIRSFIQFRPLVELDLVKG